MTSTSPNRLLEQAVAQLPVIAIVREFGDRDRTLGVVSALVAGGATALEVTTNTTCWQEAVTHARELGVHAVGAGTVLTGEHVQQALGCGASFIVSPGVDPKVIEMAQSMGMDTLPGVMTPTEIGVALSAGVRRVKLFPAGSLGLDFFSAIRAPFNDVEFVPTGGISPQNASSWLRAGAWALGMGGSLTTGSLLEIENRMRSLRDAVSADIGSRT